MVSGSLLDVTDETEDDFDLTQVAIKIENETDFSLPYHGMTLTQTIRAYDIASEEDDFEIGTFDLVDDVDKFISTISDTDLNFQEMPAVVSNVVSESRFQKPVSDEEIERLVANQTNANTMKNTKWAVRVFNAWRMSRNKNGDVISELQLMLPVSLDFWLQRFVMEVRKTSGDEYPPRSLYLIICGLLRHLRDQKVHDLNFLDENDARFANFRRVLNARMKELLDKGFGTKIKKADPVSPEDEDKLWNQGVFGMIDSTTLQHTVFFYACKLFGLRGRDEHRQLDCSQFETGQDNEGKFVRFIGRSTKTYKGGLSHIGQSNKDIKHCSDGGSRCIVSVFQKYLAALGKEGYFYRKPLPSIGNEKFRYGKQPVGVNKLDGFMKEICAKGGLSGNYSNHSGKRTCATQLYRAGIEEQEIMGRTGHRSTAVREYKTSDENILRRVSAALNPPNEHKHKIQDTEDGCVSVKREKRDSGFLSDITMKGEKRDSSCFLSDITNTKGIVSFNNCNFSLN